MRIKSIKIVKFRGIHNVEIAFNEMINFLVSNNNVGKTRVLECISQFYQGSKEDMEVEFTYLLSSQDKENIENVIKEIKKEDLKSDFKIIYKNKDYLYNNIKVNKLLDNRILGDIIYIPAISDHNNETDISKTTTSLSKMIAKILTKNKDLTQRLDDLNNDLNSYIRMVKQETKDNFDKMDKEILFNDIKLEIVDRKFDNSQIIKNNLKLKVLENGILTEISELGTGVQRSIVNAIITSGLDSDNYTIILYDEPETYLNIGLQRTLMHEINNNKSNTQYVIATHSPDIIYRNENIFSSIIKLNKIGEKNIEVKQFNEDRYISYIDEANKELQDIDYKYKLKKNIRETILAWWDRNRVNALFEDKILIVEGPTEELFIDMICNEKNIPYISTASGKFSIPYFKILFNNLYGIELVVMYDKDNEKNKNHKIINKYIQNNLTALELDNNFESCLNYKIEQSYRKPQEFLEKYFNNEIDNIKIEELKQRIYSLYYKI